MTPLISLFSLSVLAHLGFFRFTTKTVGFPRFLSPHFLCRKYCVVVEKDYVACVIFKQYKIMFQRITVQRGYRLVFDTFNTAVPATTYTRRTKGRKMLQIHLILQTIGRDVEGVRPTLLTGICVLCGKCLRWQLFVTEFMWLGVCWVPGSSRAVHSVWRLLWKVW